jgi:signal recognition particle receptor subunit beta
MSLFNYATKEITIKIVYYGPGLSGKTTNLQYLHSILDHDRRGKLLSLATEADRTLFFDFMPVDLGKIRDFTVRFQLYTVPGQVRYNATRKLVLKGADAIVFVADSQREMAEQNIESLKNMRENLIANNINPDDIPIILQYNKRDLPNISSIDELNKYMNADSKYKYVESIATDGVGIEDSFQLITKVTINDIAKKHSINLKLPEELVEPAGAETPDNFFDNTKIDPFETTAEEDKTLPKQVIVKEVREVPVFPAEKLDMLMNAIKDLSQTLKEIKNVTSSMHYEIKEMRKEQKEATNVLKGIKNNFEGLKTKKSWFRFS